MKTMLLFALACAIAACSVTPDATKTTEQALICDPTCGDGADVQALLNSYITAGQAYGSERGPAWCRLQRDAGPLGDEYYNVCSGYWGDDGGHNTQVFCNDRNGVQCWTWGCGESGEPACGS